jgi:hypothetical protein
MTRSQHLPSLLAGVAVAVVSMATTASALAEPAPQEAPQPPDVAIHQTPPPHRTFTVEWNPLSLFLDKWSFNVNIVPGNHHGLTLSPFYVNNTTLPWSTGIDANGNPLTRPNGQPYTLNVLPQRFEGFGGEIGYRYYTGLEGPRGLFAGPSILLAPFTATAANGTKTNFFDLGFAVDVGFEALIADTVALSLGGGLQYTIPSKSLPTQQDPASIYANQKLYPRMLLSLGYAF